MSKDLLTNLQPSRDGEARTAKALHRAPTPWQEARLGQRARQVQGLEAQVGRTEAYQGLGPVLISCKLDLGVSCASSCRREREIFETELGISR